MQAADMPLHDVYRLMDIVTVLLNHDFDGPLAAISSRTVPWTIVRKYSKRNRGGSLDIKDPSNVSKKCGELWSAIVAAGDSAAARHANKFLLNVVGAFVRSVPPRA